MVRMLTLTPSAKIGVVGVNPEERRWWELWTHVLEEMVLRFGPYPAGFTRDVLHTDPIPDLAGELAKRAAASLDHLHGQRVLIKFGRLDHMTALLKRGAIRLQAASFYRRPDHNGAIRDDELALDFSLHLDRATILKVVRNPQDVPAGPISRRMDVTFASRTDYWLYCVTTAVAPRLFVDFEASACVVIKDAARFTEALQAAVALRVPGARFGHGQVNYVDPVLPSSGLIDVPMSKHFRYSHQHEYRFLWLPPQLQQSLVHIDLEVGSLQEYADLISL